MVIVAVIALSTIVLTAIFVILNNLPAIPAEWVEYVSWVLPYIGRGIKFLNAFMYADIVLALAGICLALHAFWMGYRMFLWIVKKIPMLGVQD